MKVAAFAVNDAVEMVNELMKPDGVENVDSFTVLERIRESSRIVGTTRCEPRRGRSHESLRPSPRGLAPVCYRSHRPVITPHAVQGDILWWIKLGGQPAHVLVGGLGFIGYNLAARLRREGERVVVVARRSSIERGQGFYRMLTGMNVEIVDSGESVSLDSIIRGDPRVIYHLTGKPGGPYRVQYESHVGILELEIDAAQETSSRLVYVSSIAVAADAAEKPPGSIVVEEDAPPRLDYEYTTVHAQTKAVGEALLAGSGLKEWSIIRPGLVFGPRAPHAEWKMLRRLTRLGIAPVIKGVPMVNVLDVAEVLYMAGRGDFDNRWVHAVADNVSYRDVADAYCRLHGRRCTHVPLNVLVKAARVAPKTSLARLSWSITRKGYTYKSSILANYDWRLEPVGD